MVLDPNYIEDSGAEVDMNFILTAGDKFIEVQGTAEGEPFDQQLLSEMISLAKSGAKQLFEIQQAAL